MPEKAWKNLFQLVLELYVTIVVGVRRVPGGALAGITRPNAGRVCNKATWPGACGAKSSRETALDGNGSAGYCFCARDVRVEEACGVLSQSVAALCRAGYLPVQRSRVRVWVRRMRTPLCGTHMHASCGYCVWALGGRVQVNGDRRETKGFRWLPNTR